MEPTDTDEECNGCDKEPRKSHSEEHAQAYTRTHIWRVHFKDYFQKPEMLFK